MSPVAQQKKIFLRIKPVDFVIGFFAVAIPVWTYIVLPIVQAIPKNFSYAADVVSVDNLYDPITKEFKGEQYSKTKFSYKTIGSQGDTRFIQNTFEVKSLDGKPIYSAAPIYAIDARTRQHISAKGQEQRQGYLFAPAGLKKGQSYTYWHVSSTVPATMTFVKEESLYGLRVYRYETNYGGEFDQTNNLTFLPDVGKTLGIKLLSKNTLWIEPVTGYLVKQEDSSIDYYYFNLVTGERLRPYNQFTNSYSEQSVLYHAELGTRMKFIAQLLQYGVPLILFLIVVVLIFARYNRLRWLRKLVQRSVFGATIFLTMLVITAFATSITHQRASLRLQEQMSGRASAIRQAIDQRINIYLNALAGGRALFDSAGTVTREMWRTYVATLQVQASYPGIQALGFSKIISPQDVESITQSVRDEGYADFTIHPTGQRDIYTTILYIEPFTERNQRAFGYDMFSESVRKQAMIRAQESDAPAASGKVTLQQETNVDIQPGFLIYTPVYANGQHPKTVAERKSAIIGYVYSPFRMNDLMSGVLDKINESVDFHIYDGLRANSETLMYAQDGNTVVKEHPNAFFREVHTVYIAGHPWTITFQNVTGFRGALVDRYLPHVVFTGGLLMSLLVYGLLLSASRTKEIAVTYAKKLHTELELGKDELLRKNQAIESNVKELETTKKAILNVLEDVQREKDTVEKVSQRLALATQSAKIGVWEWNVTSNELIWDDQMFALYGVNKKDFSGAYDAWQKGLHPDDKDRSEQEIQKAVKKRSVFNTTFRVVWPNGEIHWIRAYGMVEGKKNSADINMVGVNWDITKEKEVDQAKSEFVSLASHQLRTPLTTINWYSELLLSGDGGKLSKTQHEFVDAISSGSQRMAALVNALLNVARIEAGTFSVTPEKVSLQEIITTVIQENSPRIKEQRQKIITNIDRAIPALLVDRQLVYIIVQNLLTNAIKYTPPKGQITVSLGRQGKFVTLSVADNGFGIPASQQSKIFQKLYRAENIRTKVTDGTGLGLYIVKSILDHTGGSISFTSIEGKGTTFTVKIPSSGMIERKGTKSLNA